MKITTERKSLIKQQISIHKTTVYTPINDRSSHQKQQIKKVTLLSSTLTLWQCHAV